MDIFIVKEINRKKTISSGKNTICRQKFKYNFRKTQKLKFNYF